MKPTSFVKYLFVFFLLLLSYDSFNNASSPPTGYSGAPSESNCTGCHNGSAVTSGTSWNAINISGLPADGYTPGSVYTLTVNGSSAATAKNGMLLTVLNSSNTNAGSLTAGTGNSVLVAARNYIGHNNSGTANSSFSFTWTAPSIGVGTVTFYLSWLATNSNGGNSGDMTYVKSFSLNQLANLPTAVINASSTSVCVGDTIILQGTGLNNPTTYVWTMTGGTPASASTQNTKVVFTTAGPKQIRLVTSNANGSSSPTVLPITVNAKPVFSVTQSANHLCGNTDTVLLSASNVSGYTYLWMPGSITTSTAKITNTGSYTVKVTTSNNCTSTSNAYTISRRNLPVSNLTSDKDSSCVKDSITLKAIGNYTSYQFKKDNVLVKSGKDSLCKIANSGTYTLQVYDGFCYSEASSKTLYVQNQLAAPSLFSDSKSMNQINYYWNAIPEATIYQISLDSGLNWTSQIDTFYYLTVSPIPQNKKIWVRALSNSLCPEGLSSSIKGSNATCIKPELGFIYLNKICLKADTEFVAFNMVNLGLGKFKYTLQKNGFIASQNQGQELKIPIYSGSNPIQLQCIDTTFTYCTIDTVLTIQASNFSKNQVQFNLDNLLKNVCATESQFELKSSRLPGADSVFFYRFDSIINKAILLNPTGQDSGILIFPPNQLAKIESYYVIQKNNESSCEAISKSGLLRFLPDIGLLISATIPQNNKQVNFQSQSDYPFQKIYWDFGNSFLDSINRNPSHTYLNAGNYIVKTLVTDSMNCSDTTSLSLNIGATGILELDGIGNLKIYPNPVLDRITIKALASAPKEVQLHVFDLNGKEVLNDIRLQFVIGTNEFSIPTEGLVKGLYVLSLEADNSVFKHIFSKE